MLIPSNLEVATNDHRKELIDAISSAGAYIQDHAADFIAQEDSDELIIEDGIAITIRPRLGEHPAIIEVTREVFVLEDDDGDD